MTRSLFGTDGVRGRANANPMTAEVALSLGKAAGKLFRRGDHPHRVVIGKDTRLSGYMIEQALTAGFLSVGMDVLLLGPLPTPAVGFLTRSMRADVGVMISASHNPYEDNGIKLFGPDGFKLSDAVEMQIERLVETHAEIPLAASCEVKSESNSSSMRSSTSSDNLKPSGPNNLMPLSSNGLCEAEIMTPRSARIVCVSMPTAGVGIGPVSSTSIPTEVKPATIAFSIM